MELSEIKVSKKYFYIKLPTGEKAYLHYEIKGNIMELLETYTPPAFRGKGLATKLTLYALEYAKERGLKVKPVCSYTIRFIIKHPEYRSLLVNEYKEINLEDLYKQRISEERARKSKTIELEYF